MAPRLKPPAAKAPASTGPPPWLSSGTNAGTAADQQPAAGTAAKAAEKAGLVSPGEIDTEITGEDLKNSIKAIVPEMRGMILSTPKSMGNFLGSFVGLGLGQPAEWAKKGGVGWAQNIPLAGFVFSKAGAEWAKSLEATAKDIWYAKTGNNDFPQYDPKTKSISYSSNEKTDRITQALRNGESPAGVLIEDFANISLIGSIFKRGFGGAAAVSEAKGAQAAGKARAAATPEEAAAFTEKAAGYTEKAQKARERQKAAATFERSTGLVGAAPIMAYTIPIKGATRLAGTAGRSFADRFREQANRLERAGDQTGRAGWYRRRADDLNRFAGTPMRDANGNAVIDPNTGKPQIVQRGAVSQWAKDRLRRVEAKKQQIVRQGLNMLMKPYAFDEVNPATGKAYGPLSPIEQEAVFAVRNGRSRLLVTLQQALPDLSLETIVQFGSRSRDDGFSLSDDGARLAVAFETQGLDPTQTRRIAEAVGALDYYIETNLAGPRREGYGTVYRDPKTGDLVRDPLDPYQDMPVPSMEGLQQALRRSAETQDLADIFDRLIEQDLSNRAVDDPVRINMIAAIAEATPTEVLAPYLSDGTLDLSIWPAKERNRIAEVMAIREALGQRGVEEVIGTPPPKDGPGGAPRPLQEDPTTGLPTVEDIVAQKFPGQLPRSSARYMMNSIKALGKLRGRARALAQQMYDSQIAIDAAERHIVEMHLQLMELEGFWLNRLGRRVEPNKKGELPKSARRIEGLVAEARAIRDEQLALYDDMVAKQQESIVIEGVSVGRDVIASNVENLSRAIDDVEAKVEAIEQTVGELAQLAEQLADHDAKAAALLELEGADPQALRAVIDADLQNMPAELSDFPTLGKEFAGADEIVANGVTGLESINKRIDVLAAERDRLQDEYDAELEQFDEGMGYKEYQAAITPIDERYVPRMEAIETQMGQLFDVKEAFITQLTGKLSDYISALDPIRAVELSERLKALIDVAIVRERDVESMLRSERHNATRAYLDASIKLQEIYAEQLVPLVSSLQASLGSPSDPVSWPGQAFNEPAAPGAATVAEPPAPEAGLTPEEQAANDAYTAAQTAVKQAQDDVTNSEAGVARLKKMSEAGGTEGGAPAYGLEEANADLADEFNRGYITSNKIKQFNDAVEYSYAPPTKAKDTAKALDSSIFAALKDGVDGRVFVQEVDGTLWYSNSYVLTSIPEDSFLARKVREADDGPDGRWGTDAKNKADAQKLPIKRRGDGPNLAGLLDTAKKRKYSEPAVVVDSYKGSDGGGYVVLRAGDVEAVVSAEWLSQVLGPDRTIHIDLEGGDRPLIVRQGPGTKDNTVALVMPMKGGKAPDSIAGRIANAAEAVLGKGPAKNRILSNLRKAEQEPVAAPSKNDIAAAEKDLKDSRARLKMAEAEAKRLKPIERKAALKPVTKPAEPTAPTAARTLPVSPRESVRVSHRGVLYELRITQGGWDSKKYYYPGVIQLVRILDNVDESMARYKESTGVDTDVAPFASPVPGFSLKTGQRANEIVLDEAGIAKIEAAIKKDADELAKNKKYKSVDVRPTMQRAEEAFVVVDETGSLRQEFDDMEYLVYSRGINDMVNAVRVALHRTQKLAASGKARSKNSKLRNDIYPLERNIAALDAAIANYDRTGNWMGLSYGITGIQGLGVNYLVNLGDGPDGNRLRRPALSGGEGISRDTFNIESIREAAMSFREGLVAQLEERMSNLTPDQLAEVSKDAGNQAKAAASTDPPKTNALNAKSWTKMQDGSLQFDTGTRTYEVRTVERPGPAGKKKLNDFVLKRVGSDGLPIESTTRVFKTFASARKYVAETVSIDGNMAAAYSGPKATLELEPPKTPPFPKDLIDAEARLAKLEGRRVSLLKGLNREEAKLTKLRIRDAKTRALQPRVAAAEARLEARLGREIITQPEVTQVGGKDIPVSQEFGVRLRPTETQRRMRQPDGQPLSEETRATYEAVEASLNEANMRRRERVPVTIAMRSSMSLPREQVPTGQQLPGRFRDVVDVYGARYVPATGRSTGEPGPARVFVEGLTGRRKLSSQKFRTGNYEEIYNMRTLIERVVAENRQMNQNEAIVALMSSQFAVTAEELLGPELIEKFDRDAFRYVASSASEGGIDAYQPGRLDRDAFFKKQYEQRRGQLIREEMGRRGWETNPGEYTNIEAARPDRHINATTRFLPKYVRTAVMRKTAFVDPSAFNVYLKNVQRGTTLFKNLTLPLSITWQLGDIISTFLLSALTGIPTDQLIRNMKVAYEQNYGGGVREMFKGESDRTIGSVGEFISESGLQDVGLRLEERAALKGIEPTKIGSLPSRIPVVGAVPRAYGWFRERAYRFNEFTNRLGRQAYFMSRLENSLKEYNAAQRQLDSNHIDVTMERIADFRLHETNAEIGRLFWDTINQANDVMGDWLDLAPWERRYVMPHITFYAWVKHINKLFFKLAMNDPTKIMWYMYLGQLAYEPDTDPFGILAGYVPSFAKGFLSRLDFAGPFSDVASGVPWNIFEQFASGNASEATLEPAAALFSPAPRLMAAAVGKSLKGGITDLGRPPGTGAVTQSGREVSPSLLSPARFGELVGATIDTFPLLRKLADLAPDGQIPFTDVQLGPYKTYETGYARTIPGTNIKVEKPMGRLGALLNLFNVPLRPAKTEQQIIEEQIQAIKDVESFRKQKAKLEALRD